MTGNELDIQRDHHLVKGVRRDNLGFIGEIPTIKQQGIVRSEGGKVTAQTRAFSPLTGPPWILIKSPLVFSTLEYK